jgi:integrase
MTQACRALLERIKHDREEEPAMESVMRVHEAQKSLDRGLETLSLPRITHHDLRHYFATICIESGVDIPTFSKWARPQRRRRPGHEGLWPLAQRTLAGGRQSSVVCGMKGPLSSARG